MFPFWKVKFDKDANPADPAAVDTLVSEVKSQGVTDLFIFSHGWNNDEAAASWLYQSFFGEVAKLMANPAVAKKNQAGEDRRRRDRLAVDSLARRCAVDRPGPGASGAIRRRNCVDVCLSGRSPVENRNDSRGQVGAQVGVRE
jgi:hypothetical protein